MTLDSIKDFTEFDDHKLVTFFHCKKTDLNGFISIHRANGKYPSFGATRIWNYKSYKDALIDSLRLSKTMSYKAALAGLHCGGSKAVIIANTSEIKNRKELLKSYAEKVNFLEGHFITGADVGISKEDVKFMKKFSPFFVGANLDPARYTSLGLLMAIQICLKEVFGTEDLKGRSFAIQGVGKIGLELIKLIYPHTHNIYITDIDNLAIKNVVNQYPDLKVVAPKEIYKQQVDVFSPCALSNCINKDSVDDLHCVIVAGGANSQLENDEIAAIIHRKGILYAPDYVVNAGGLISVYDEYNYGNSRVNRVKNRIKIIKKNMQRIINQSKISKKSTTEVANTMAQEIFDRLI